MRAASGRCCAVMAVVIGCLAMYTAWAEARPVRVMLTNDDGYQAPGLAAVRGALEAAGFDVTVVAPLRQQSGSGARITLGEMAVVAHDRATWSVDGSPADSAAYGLTEVLKQRAPDVVVSGANLGQNLGANVVSSGTVGAAVMAAQLGVPAIAVSVGLDMAQAKAQPTPFPDTVAAYPLAADFVARLITRLAAAAGGGPVLPANTLLNINVPARPAEQIKGVRLAPLAQHGGFRVVYRHSAEPARVLSSIEVEPAGANEVEADAGWFARDYITVSVLRADWNAASVDSTALRTRLGDLESLRGAP